MGPEGHLVEDSVEPVRATTPQEAEPHTGPDDLSPDEALSRDNRADKTTTRPPPAAGIRADATDAPPSVDHMRLIPSRINAAWIGTLADDDLVDIEARLHERFSVLDQRYRRTAKEKYVLMRGPTELIDAWDRWSRISVAARHRSLVTRLRPKD